MRHTLPRRFMLAASASLLAGRGLAAEGQKPPPPAGLVAGVALPLSGDLSLTGSEVFRGIELALAEINAEGGIAGQAVALVTADARGQNFTAMAVNGLVRQHASVLFGGGSSDICYAASAAAELAQVPFIELDAPADGITGRGFGDLVRTSPTTTMIAQTAVAAMLKHHARAKIGILFNTGATGGAIAAAALAALAAAQKTPVLVIGYPADQADLHDQAGRLQRAGAEILLHAAGPSDVLGFYVAMQGSGWRPAAIFGCGDGYLLRETAFALGAVFDGTYVVGAPFYPPRAAYIAAAYQARYGQAPRAASSLSAFVGARLVFDVLNSVGGDPAKLLAALHRTDIPLGTLANGWGVAIDHNGQNTRNFVLLQQWRGQVLGQVAGA
jgi:branched-chain amino acid transport system substrate-binding protein